IASEFRHLAVSNRRELLGGSDAIETGPARSGAGCQPRRHAGDAGGRRARTRAHGAERRDPAARPAGAAGAQPARARRVHAAALRRPVDRRDFCGARTRHERCQAQRVSGGEEAAHRTRTAAESGIVTHYSEDDLTLYYYGEGRRRADIERHLDSCAACAALYREIAGTLALIAAPEVPQRGEQYGLEVWQRIRHQLPEQDVPWWTTLFQRDRLVSAAAAAALVLVAFVAGRGWPRPHPAPAAAAPSSATAVANGGSAVAGDSRQRILLTSVAEHLDRSERVLTDIMNAPDRGNISTEQQWAADLLDASRLYRQEAPRPPP